MHGQFLLEWTRYGYSLLAEVAEAAKTVVAAVAADKLCIMHRFR